MSLMTNRKRSQRTESSAAVSRVDLRPSLPLKSSKNTTVDDEEEPVEKLVEGFGKKSLVLLAKEAVSKHPDLIERVRKLATINPALRKIVVMDLSENITAETIASVFREFGEIEEYGISFTSSYLSRGMAYVILDRRIGALKALKQPYKVIDNNTMVFCLLESLQVVSRRSLLKISPPPIDQNQPPLLDEEEETVEKLLEAFGMDYLLFFNKEAVSKYPDLIEPIHRLADTDPKLRRVFVTKILKFTTVKTLEIFFGRFGEVNKIEGVKHHVQKCNASIILFKNRHGPRKLLKQTKMDADFGINGYILISPTTTCVERG